ncbi:exopolyphosphatase [Usitatibacter palustris]|uniref:Exopolyphosphatase n=1 Tax=Usitatibacter palustris TaxID=2732487 RepID=A0A6M4H7Z4_9PROT|nr:exopolyphosphatase [Usitatibacter palustris]QJR15492.1 Exopolyphosphatase [Usitatibacter palustris]
MEYTTLAAVDLGSNSFHMAVGRVVDDQIYPLDSLKETVRLGAGLTSDKRLDADAQDRALATLRRFRERLAGMPKESVRVVGTNTLRVAKNAREFLAKAESTLGFPIEIISGREEARLIYMGVVHSLPLSSQNRLVVDIGGGSTEFIIGNKMKPRVMESLYMGCVSYTRRFFPEGKVDKKSFKAAELAAREEVQALVERFEKEGWKEAVGSSGTARALAEVITLNGRSNDTITAGGLAWLREELIESGDVRKLAIAGLRDERIPVFPGGLAIMSAVFSELSLKEMIVAEGALRQGVLWDLLGRVHHRDIREVTIEQFVRRYHVDAVQATRVGSLARALYRQLEPERTERTFVAESFLAWGVQLHEIGLSISQGGYHKHSAYILANADMPGFSRQEQAWLANLVLAQRGKLAKMREAFAVDADLATLSFCLRVAVILHRARRTLRLPKISASRRGKTFILHVEAKWLEAHTLAAHAFEAERDEWDSTGFAFEVEEK